MVRFIIHNIRFNFSFKVLIYIPIWLDLLSLLYPYSFYRILYLHSNMVRFIIFLKQKTTYTTGQIYIPIWLDLLFVIQLVITI